MSAEARREHRRPQPWAFSRLSCVSRGRGQRGLFHHSRVALRRHYSGFGRLKQRACTHRTRLCQFRHLRFSRIGKRSSAGTGGVEAGGLILRRRCHSRRQIRTVLNCASPIAAVATAEPKATSVAAVAVKPASHSFVTASLGSGLFDNRGYWRGAIQDGSDLPAAVTASTKYQTASLDPSTTGTAALAYAPEFDDAETDTGSSMGALPKRQPAEAMVMPAQGNMTIRGKAGR